MSWILDIVVDIGYCRGYWMDIGYPTKSNRHCSHYGIVFTNITVSPNLLPVKHRFLLISL